MTFDLQGHRGCRGLKPENTLPGFETALDLGVSSIETDLRPCQGQLLLIHDQRWPGATLPISEMKLDEVRRQRTDRNPDPAQFPRQDDSVTPLAGRLAAEWGIHPYAIPTLAEFFALVAAYAGEPGRRAGKPAERRQRAGRLTFDLEVKHQPFWPDREDGHRLVRMLVDAVRQAGLVERTRVRSFDHRLVQLARRLEPGLTGGVLVAGAAPVAAAELARTAAAQLYCPAYAFLDAEQIRHCHEAGIRVIPWTVNDPNDMARLLSWGVDGITTDYPDRLAELLRERSLEF